MDLREQYYNLIKLKNLPNILNELEELSYSKKLKLVEELLNRFDVQVVKIALGLYKQNYIDICRVNIVTLRNTIIGLCNNIIFTQNLLKERKTKCS